MAGGASNLIQGLRGAHLARCITRFAGIVMQSIAVRLQEAQAAFFYLAGDVSMTGVAQSPLKSGGASARHGTRQCPSLMDEILK